MRIEYSKSSAKFLRKLEKELIIRIVNCIEKLKKNSVPSDAKFIGRENNDKIFRIRVGKYRILYKIKINEEIILITKIDKRAKVYN